MSLSWHRGAAAVSGAEGVFSGHWESCGKRVARAPMEIFCWARFYGLGGSGHGQRRGGARGSWPMRAMGFLQTGQSGGAGGGGAVKGGGGGYTGEKRRGHFAFGAALRRPR